jgi:hypothetical protein
MRVHAMNADKSSNFDEHDSERTNTKIFPYFTTQYYLPIYFQVVQLHDSEMYFI